MSKTEGIKNDVCRELSGKFSKMSFQSNCGFYVSKKFGRT